MQQFTLCTWRGHLKERNQTWFLSYNMWFFVKCLYVSRPFASISWSMGPIIPITRASSVAGESFWKRTCQKMNNFPLPAVITYNQYINRLPMESNLNCSHLINFFFKKKSFGWQIENIFFTIKVIVHLGISIQLPQRTLKWGFLWKVYFPKWWTRVCKERAGLRRSGF